jgi:hypothetical protein
MILALKVVLIWVVLAVLIVMFWSRMTPQLTMNTLINRRKVPPRGYLYRCPVCGFKLKNPLSSLTEVVREIRIHRRNNPSHTSLSTRLCKAS